VKRTRKLALIVLALSVIITAPTVRAGCIASSAITSAAPDGTTLIHNPGYFVPYYAPGYELYGGYYGGRVRGIQGDRCRRVSGIRSVELPAKLAFRRVKESWICVNRAL